MPPAPSYFSHATGLHFSCPSKRKHSTSTCTNEQRIKSGSAIELRKYDLINISYLSLVTKSNQRHTKNLDVGISPVFILCGFAVLFKQVNSIGNQKCFVQDMALAKFPSSKQCRVRIRKLESNDIVTVQFDVKYFCVR